MIVAILILAAITFGVCFAADKGFQGMFRNAPQHMDGRSVRLHRWVGLAGLALVLLGVFGIMAGIPADWLLLAGGGLLTAIGLALCVYYLTFGIYYDGESFVYMSFGKKSATFLFGQIAAQQLYITQGKVLVELHMEDGRVVQLQAGLTGRDEFMDQAFNGWLKQKGLQKEACSFYDPDNNCWFPPLEEK
jgi:hypothetical protein